MKQYYLDYSILAIMVIAVITYSPDAQAAQKLKGLVGFASFATGYTVTDPIFDDDPTEFNFGVTNSVGFVSDYFFGDKQKTAFAVDVYSVQAFLGRGAHTIEAGDPPDRYDCPTQASCDTTLTQSARLISVMLGYRYHFSGYDSSTGYLGIGALIGSLDGETVRFNDSESPEISGSHKESGGPKGGIGISPALSGGYDWKLKGDKNSRRKNPLVMGIHLMYSPDTKYGDVDNVGVITVGYTVGGIVGSN